MPGYPGSDGVPVRSGVKYSNISLKENMSSILKQNSQKNRKNAKKLDMLKIYRIKIDIENSKRE